MSIPTDQIHRAAALRERYITIHEDCFGRPLWKVFSPIPFAAHASALDSLLKDISNHRQSVERVTLLGRAIGAYLDSLEETVRHCRLVVGHLAVKSDGGAYTAADYRREVAHYDMLRDSLLAAGTALNQAIAASPR